MLWKLLFLCVVTDRSKWNAMTGMRMEGKLFSFFCFIFLFWQIVPARYLLCYESFVKTAQDVCWCATGSKQVNAMLCYVCRHDFIGEFVTSLRELSRGPGDHNRYECISPKKKAKKGNKYSNSGVVRTIAFCNYAGWSTIWNCISGKNVHFVTSLIFILKINLLWWLISGICCWRDKSIIALWLFSRWSWCLVALRKSTHS
jgi:hypothetical protein